MTNPKETTPFDLQKANAELMSEYVQKIGHPVEDDAGNLRVNFGLLGTISPSFGAARTVDIVLHGKDQNAATAMVMKNAIDQQSKDVSAVIEVFTGQVTTLNTLFNKHVQLASVMQDPERAAQHFDMAMRAQDSCRKTMEALNQVLNPQPKAVYIRNAIATQVNDITLKFEQLEKRLKSAHGVEFGETRAIPTGDPEMETLGEVNWPQDSARKGQGRKKQPTARS